MDNARPGQLSSYYNFVWYGSGIGPGAECRSARDEVTQLDLSTEQQQELAELDEILIDWVVGENDDAVWWELIEDDPSQPVDRWWWHLGAIRSGTYPTNLLPSNLLQAYDQAKAA